MIRPATQDDLNELSEFFEACFWQMRFDKNGFTYDHETVINRISGWIEDDNGLVLVSKTDKIDGCIILFITETLYDINTKMACEVAWHAHPALSDIKKLRVMIRLLKEGIKWSKNLPLNLSVQHGNDTLDKILVSLGFTCIESMYQKRGI